MRNIVKVEALFFNDDHESRNHNRSQQKKNTIEQIFFYIEFDLCGGSFEAILQFQFHLQIATADSSTLENV